MRLDIVALATDLDLYRQDNGFYPIGDQGLKALKEEQPGFPDPREWGSDQYYSFWVIV